MPRKEKRDSRYHANEASADSHHEPSLSQEHDGETHEGERLATKRLRARCRSALTRMSSHRLRLQGRSHCHLPVGRMPSARSAPWPTGSIRLARRYPLDSRLAATATALRGRAGESLPASARRPSTPLRAITRPLG